MTAIQKDQRIIRIIELDLMQHVYTYSYVFVFALSILCVYVCVFVCVLMRVCGIVQRRNLV